MTAPPVGDAAGCSARTGRPAADPAAVRGRAAGGLRGQKVACAASVGGAGSAYGARLQNQRALASQVVPVRCRPATPRSPALRRPRDAGSIPAGIAGGRQPAPAPCRITQRRARRAPTRSATAADRCRPPARRPASRRRRAAATCAIQPPTRHAQPAAFQAAGRRVRRAACCAAPGPRRRDPRQGQGEQDAPGHARRAPDAMTQISTGRCRCASDRRAGVDAPARRRAAPIEAPRVVAPGASAQPCRSSASRRPDAPRTETPRARKRRGSRRSRTTSGPTRSAEPLRRHRVRRRGIGQQLAKAERRRDASAAEAASGYLSSGASTGQTFARIVGCAIASGWMRSAWNRRSACGTRRCPSA